MAYKLSDVLFLDAAAETTTGAGDFVTSLDVSSYVQPVVRKGQKAIGLAIYKVHWDISPAASNDAVDPAMTGVFRAGIFSDLGFPAAAAGGISIANDTLNAGNDLAVSIIDWWGGGTAAGDPHPITWLMPSTEVPYVIVRDTIQLVGSISTATSVSLDIRVRLECATITIDMATLNQLLRTQTV